MSSEGSFDVPAAHRFFSAQCFNLTWELLDKPDRSPTDNMTMFLRSAASLWHWTQRPDCTRQNLSIGYWQMSRVLATTGQGQLAKHFGTLCLEAAPKEDSFCRAYAFEALARAASILQDHDEVARCVAQVQSLAGQVEDVEERALILADLRTIGGQQGS